MKTRVLLLGAVITAFALRSFAAEPLLTPRMQGNQPKYVASTASDPDLVAASRNTLLAPRAFGNQSKVVPGVANDSNPALVCAKTMAGTPKMIGECVSHTTMPGCVAVAPRNIPPNWPETTQQNTVPSSATVAPLK